MAAGSVRGTELALIPMRQAFTCRERICELFFRPQVVVEQAPASVKASRKNQRCRSIFDHEDLLFALEDGQLVHRESRHRLDPRAGFRVQERSAKILESRRQRPHDSRVCGIETGRFEAAVQGPGRPLS